MIEVILPVPLFKTFYYKTTHLDRSPEVGDLVLVPFRNTECYGLVVNLLPEDNNLTFEVKECRQILFERPAFNETFLQLIRWTADYYVCPEGEIFSCVFPKSFAKSFKTKKTSKRSQKTECDVGFDTVAPLKLTEEQSEVLERLHLLDQSKPFLLHGVTGSGKTEVYIRLIQSTLAKEKSALVLVPEIALTPQLVARFKARFSQSVAILHSELTPKEKWTEWEKIRTHQVKIVIGVRSAIFAPLQNLGLIIVDEEHENSFKQDETPKYHARDLAIVRGKLEKATVILGSATPSIESYFNAQNHRYHYLTLKHRVQERPLPEVEIIDLKNKELLWNPKYRWLSKPLLRAIDETLKRQQQTILYLNRLGFSHYLICADCGHHWKCSNCDVSLTYYQIKKELVCHYCNLKKVIPTHCSECKGLNLETVGVGTEQLERVLQEVFPTARIGRMDRSEIKNRNDLEALLKRVVEKQLDILIGTQMVTKGHDFPGVVLVGVLLADNSLNIPDFRAQERTYQILTQVAGRAGRGTERGKVIIQTYNPQNLILQTFAKKDMTLFYGNELNARKQFGFPPFERMVLYRFQHTNEAKVKTTIQIFQNQISKIIHQHKLPVQILGPAPCPLLRVKNKYRWQILLKSSQIASLKSLNQWVVRAFLPQEKQVAIFADMDPQHIF